MSMCNPLQQFCFKINSAAILNHSPQFIAISTHANGSDCAQVPELGENARAYEERAAKYLKRYNIGVVDVGIANIEYPATSLQQVMLKCLFPVAAFHFRLNAAFSYKSTATPLVPLYQRS